jgi:hypothetical protein
MACEIKVAAAPPDSTNVSGTIGIAVTTNPGSRPVSWSGNLGEGFTFLVPTGHQIATSWETPGIKVLLAKCESSVELFTVFVKSCNIIQLISTRHTVPMLREVLIEVTCFAPGESQKDVKTVSPSPKNFGATPKSPLHFTVPSTCGECGLSRVLAAACGSGQPKSLSIIVLPNTEDEVEVEEQKKCRQVSIGFNDSAAVLGILGGVAALASLPVSAGLLAVAAGANPIYSPGNNVRLVLNRRCA